MPDNYRIIDQGKGPRFGPLPRILITVAIDGDPDRPFACVDNLGIARIITEALALAQRYQDGEVVDADEACMDDDEITGLEDPEPLEPTADLIDASTVEALDQGLKSLQDRFGRDVLPPGVESRELAALLRSVGVLRGA